MNVKGIPLDDQTAMAMATSGQAGLTKIFVADFYLENTMTMVAGRKFLYITHDLFDKITKTSEHRIDVDKQGKMYYRGVPLFILEE